MTAIPAVDLSLPVGSDVVVLPHFADGSGWKTHLLLVNPTDAVTAGTLSFTEPGTPTSPPGSSLVELEGNDTYQYSLPPRSGQRIETRGVLPGLRVGSVRLGPASGSAAPFVSAIFAFETDGITVSETGRNERDGRRITNLRRIGGTGGGGGLDPERGRHRQPGVHADNRRPGSHRLGRRASSHDGLDQSAGARSTRRIPRRPSGLRDALLAFSRRSAGFNDRRGGNRRDGHPGPGQRARRFSDGDDPSGARNTPGPVRPRLLRPLCRRRRLYHRVHPSRGDAGATDVRFRLVLRSFRSADQPALVACNSAIGTIADGSCGRGRGGRRKAMLIHR